MHNSGFVQLSRDFIYTDEWHNARPEYQAIFMTILMRMAYKETTQDCNGKKIIVQPLQLFASQRKIADWTSKYLKKDNVEAALKYFSKCQFLRHELRHGKTLITITYSSICECLLKTTPTETPTKLRQTSATKEEREERKEVVSSFSISKRNEKEKVLRPSFRSSLSYEEDLQTFMAYASENNLKLKEKDFISWLKKNSSDKITKTLLLMLKQTKPVFKQAAWMQKALDENWVDIDEKCKIEKEFAENFQRENGWWELKITEQYCRDEQTKQDFQYKLPHFREMLIRAYEQKKLAM